MANQVLLSLCWTKLMWMVWSATLTILESTTLNRHSHFGVSGWTMWIIWLLCQRHTHAAVFLSNSEEEPVIGIVKGVTEDHFKIHYWKGTYRGKWCPSKNKGTLDRSSSQGAHYSPFLWTYWSNEAAGNYQKALNGKVYFTQECCQ